MFWFLRTCLDSIFRTRWSPSFVISPVTKCNKLSKCEVPLILRKGKRLNIYGSNFQDRNAIAEIYLQLLITWIFTFTIKFSDLLKWYVAIIKWALLSEKALRKVSKKLCKHHPTTYFALHHQKLFLTTRYKKVKMRAKCTSGHCCGLMVQIFLWWEHMMITQGKSAD